MKILQKLIELKFNYRRYTWTIPRFTVSTRLHQDSAFYEFPISRGLRRQR